MEKDTSREFYFQWHIFSKCNLRCKHCYQDDYSHGEMDLEKLKRVADQMILALTKWDMWGRVSLTGGEPFASEHLYAIMDYLEQSERIVSINILTNGTLITREDIEKLKGYRKLRQIQISLDGGNATTHDAVRGKGAFEKAINAIRLLKANDFEVALMYTLMKTNKDNYMEFVDVAEQEGVDYITLERVTPCGNSSVDDILTKEELRKIYMDITRRANGMEKTTVRRSRPLWINTECENTREDVKLGGFCPVGLTALCILWDGTVLPCRRLEIPIGNILEDGIFKIWYESDVLWNIRDKNKLKGKCGRCGNLAYCGGCRAIAYALTGDYMEEDKQCWI